jgi:predicted acylesterase/phospholipase RssA
MKLKLSLAVIMLLLKSTSAVVTGDQAGESLSSEDEHNLSAAEAVINAESDIYIPRYNDKLTEADELGIDEHDVEAHEDHRPRGRKCHCLALSDSHNIGPYQAGVIIGLTTDLATTGQVDYDVVSGIALGALNAFIVSSTQYGEKPDVIRKKLEDFWFALADRNDDLIRSWSWGMIYGFFYE